MLESHRFILAHNEADHDVEFDVDISKAQEEAMEKARAGLRKTVRRLNRTYEQSKSNHILYLLLFAVGVFTVLYTWIKFYRMIRWIV